MQAILTTHTQKKIASGKVPNLRWNVFFINIEIVNEEKQRNTAVTGCGGNPQ